MRGFRALLWSALLATAHAQFVPSVTRRSETAWPGAEPHAAAVPSPQTRIATAPASPETKLAADSAPHSTKPKPARRRMAASRFTHGVFKYLAEPESETHSQRDDDITPYAGLVISGGQIIELTSDLTASLGTGAGQISWAGNGGFNACLHDTIVRLNNSTSPVIWGVTEHFIGASDVLVFGSATSGATVIWDTKIDLGGGERTIRIIDNIADAFRTKVRFDQGFSNGDLVFEGVGIADLSAANNDWHGSLTVNEAEVHANLDASLNGLYSITIERGGRFLIDNLGNHSSWDGGRYLENRLSQFTTINLNSGVFAYWGQKHGHSFERTGIIEILGGANVIDVSSYHKNQSTVLTIGGLYRNNGTTLNITNARTSGGSFGTGGNTPQLKFRDQAGPWAMPDLESGIIPWATVNGTDFATLKGKHLVAYTDYHTGGESTWLAKHNVSLTTDQHLTCASREINSLRLEGGRKITLTAAFLTINAGALLSTGSQNNSIEGGHITVSTSEFFMHVYGTGVLRISSDISKNNNWTAPPLSLVKSGSGTLLLNGEGRIDIRGHSYINEGTLILAKAPSTVYAGHITVGDGGLHEANLVIHGKEQIGNRARLTLRGSSRLSRDPSDPSGEIWKHSHSNLIIYDSIQYLDTLTIEGSGIIHFVRSGYESANLLGFDHILMANSTSELLIRGWQAFDDHLLIHRNARAEVAQYLDQIKFEGYEGTKLIDYDSNYFEIVPTWFNGVPEPGTTGAILSAGALGFFAWRKRRSRNK